MVAATDWADAPVDSSPPTPLRTALLAQSLATSTAAMVGCLVLGLPVAWLLARVEPSAAAPSLRVPGDRAAGAAPVVAGGRSRDGFGLPGCSASRCWHAPASPSPSPPGAVVLAHVFVSMPFVVLAIEGALRIGRPGVRRSGGHPRRLEMDHVPPGHGARSLPGILAGMVLGWARSLGEFGATITFNGNYPGTTQTMPTLIYVTRQTDQDAALALSLVMLVMSIAVLLLLRDRWLGTP